MMINKIASVLFILFLVSCNTITAPVPTLEKTTPTFAPIPSSTFQPVETAIPSPTSSQIAPSVDDDSCMKTARTQVEMNQCAGQGLEAFQAKLDALIVELKAHMRDEQYQRLLQVQDEWKTVAEDHCRWQADFFKGGTVQPMIYTQCLGSLYVERIDMLRLNLCEGNGMTGECEESLKYEQ